MNPFDIDVEGLMGLDSEPSYQLWARRRSYYSGEKLATCKYCGKSDLHWKLKSDGRWFLHNSNGNPHGCRNVRCNACGVAGLHWVEIPGESWVLKDADEEIHECGVKPWHLTPRLSLPSGTKYVRYAQNGKLERCRQHDAGATKITN